MLAKLPIAVALRLGLFDRWLVAQDPRRLCKRLKLDGYEHLVASDEGDGRLELAVSPTGPWQAVLWTVVYYRGPVSVELNGGSHGSLKALHGLGVTVAGDESTQRLAVLSEGGESILRATATVEGKGLRVTFTPA